MGRPKKGGKAKKKTGQEKACDKQPDQDQEQHQPLGEPSEPAADTEVEVNEEVLEKEGMNGKEPEAVTQAHTEAEVNGEERVNVNEVESEIALSEEHPEHTDQPKRKRQRGPTKMKNIAKDPSRREHVDFTELGEPVGPGSVKLSSYLGPLVREHVPVVMEDWRKLSEEMKTVLWKSVQARFDLDEEYQKSVVIKQMGCLWRASKSRLVTQIRNTCQTNQERMNLRPKNVPINEWRKFLRIKTSSAFKAVSDQYKERRSKQIPHTCSRKGMVRLAEDMKKDSEEPDKISRLKVWVRSRTRKDGTPVNITAAEKFKKAAELVDSDGAVTTSSNPKEDLLSQLLGPDNPGRLRVMGRSMSMSRLACFQVKSKIMTEMQDRMHQLENELASMKRQRQEPEVGENSAAARSVNRKSQPKCILVDWSGGDENVAEGRMLSSDPKDFVNDIPLGPLAVKVLVETAINAEAFLWRPATGMYNIEEAVGEMIAWPANKCVTITDVTQPEDITPRSATPTSLNKCKLLDWSTNDKVVAEGRWLSKEPKALVNGLPLGPNAVKVFLDVVHEPTTFLWRPTSEMRYLEDSLMSFVAWPASGVVFEESANATSESSPVQTPATSSKSPVQKSPTPPPRSPIKKSKPIQQSPTRRSQRNIAVEVPKENQKCKLMDISGKKQVVAEGRWSTNNPDQTVHHVPLGPNAVRVWVDIVKVSNAKVWRPSDEIDVMEDAIGTAIAWPEDKVIML